MAGTGAQASTREVVVIVKDEVTGLLFTATFAGLKEQAAPAGRPEHVSATCPEKAETLPTVIVLMADCPAAAVAVEGLALIVKSLPVPEIETVWGLLLASSLIDNVADETPVAAGLKLTVKLQLAFGDSVAPQFVVKENGPMGSDSLWIFRLTVHELVSVTT